MNESMELRWERRSGGNSKSILAVNRDRGVTAFLVDASLPSTTSQSSIYPEPRL